ncbi:STAS/SEC14 domain-containing protein [Oceaniglobus trochenteri]|uniref:STAS/SEC14 domain-containing protein n=1 Tax=Oceaniglobus trochenteri TaxID=2763260 RepID=UPI001CFF9190|nr:STAS/SEC14 domain-containing protein [Oceaniglobus trochenteri]
MIEIEPRKGNEPLEFRMTGKITGGDYENILSPAIEEALADGGKIRCLAQIGPGFEGYAPGAMFDDARLGIRHWGGFDRMAVVTDTDWIANGIRIFGFTLPCPVKVFDLDELDEARRWLRESLGSIHLDDLGDDTLQVRLLGKLDSAAYDRAEEGIDGFIDGHAGLKLLLDLREFDGWQGLSALGDHLSLVRDHYRIPDKVAVVGSEGWQKLAERVMSRFVRAETRYFDEDHFDDARRWLGLAATKPKDPE